MSKRAVKIIQLNIIPVLILVAVVINTFIFDNFYVDWVIIALAAVNLGFSLRRMRRLKAQEMALRTSYESKDTH